jgi:hypothetical protein
MIEVTNTTGKNDHNVYRKERITNSIEASVRNSSLFMLHFYMLATIFMNVYKNSLVTAIFSTCSNHLSNKSIFVFCLIAVSEAFEAIDHPC